MAAVLMPEPAAAMPLLISTAGIASFDSNDIAALVESMGFSGILAEGADHVLDRRERRVGLGGHAQATAADHGIEVTVVDPRRAFATDSRFPDVVVSDARQTPVDALPDDTLVYPGHDYNGRHVSTIGEEKATNARLAGRTREVTTTRTG